MTASPWLIAAGGLGGTAAGLALLAPTHHLLRRHDAPPRWSSAVTAATCVAATSALCAALTWRLPPGPALAAALWLAAVAAPLSVLDIAVRRLPDLLVMPCYAGVTVTLATFSVHIGQWGGSVRAVLAAAATGVVFLFIAIVAGGQMGLGDVKLGGLIGLVTGGHGWSSVAHAAVAGFALAAVAGAVLILARRATARTHQPFGPYLLAGAFVTLML